MPKAIATACSRITQPLPIEVLLATSYELLRLTGFSLYHGFAVLEKIQRQSNQTPAVLRTIEFRDADLIKAKTFDTQDD